MFLALPKVLNWVQKNMVRFAIAFAIALGQILVWMFIGALVFLAGYVLLIGWFKMIVWRN
jgi:hypothetical protein